MSLDIKMEIAQRLGVEVNDLQPVLETVIQRIRQQVAHYGYARLSGLGTFRGRDGALIFEPDPALAETVNLRFAGLEPISVKGWRVDGDAALLDTGQVHSAEDDGSTPLLEEQPLSALADEDEEETEWQELEDIEGGHPLGPLPPTAFEDAEYSVLDEESAEEVEPVDEILGDEPAPAGPHAEHERGAGADEKDLGPLPVLSFGDEADEDEDTPDEAVPASVETDNVEAENAIVPSAAAAQTDEPDKAALETHEGPTAGTLASDREPHAQEVEGRGRPSKRIESGGDEDLGSRRNTLLLVLGLLVLLAAAALAYFAMQPPNGNEPAIAAETETEQSAETPQTGEDAINGDTGESAGGAVGESVGGADSEDAVVAGEQPEPTDSPSPAEQPAESTALRGAGGINTAAGGFTIVVYSETSEGSAQNVAQRYEGQGFRSDVISSQGGGGSRYRVGVGQFETLEDAMDARNQLAGTQLPADAWVYRLE